MPVPPPPPPPPPSAGQVAIPKSNKNLLQSIELGTRLKKVPESAKNDRSSGIAGAGPVRTGIGSNNVTKPISQNQRDSVVSRPASNNSSNDFHGQLLSQLSSMKTTSNGVQERKTSVPMDRYTSVRPPSNQLANKEFPIAKNPTMANAPSAKVTKAQPDLLQGTRMPQPFLAQSDPHRGPQPNQAFQVRARVAPPMPANNKPMMSKNPQGGLLLVNRPASMPPTASATVAAPQPKPLLASNSRAPAPNQPLPNGSRAPPPPPAKSKPVVRNSISMENIVPVSATQACSEPLMRSRVQPASEVSSRPSSGVTRTTGNPPPPVPGPFRPNMARPASSVLPPAPPVPSRVSVQTQPSVLSTVSPQRYSVASSASTPPPYKVADRAPPPPPPGVARASIFQRIPFDRRFTFPDVSQFPPVHARP